MFEVNRYFYCMMKSDVEIGTDIIKRSTKEVHAETELILIPQLKNINSKEDYIQILQTFYSFFAPLEKIIFKFISEEHISNLKHRRKAFNIESDLIHLKASATGIEYCRQLPPINSLEDAFGALYVLEGSTLGGVHIAKMIKGNKHTNIEDNALSFFLGYGDETEFMWDHFKDQLNHFIRSEQQLRQVICSANETFNTLKAWFLHNAVQHSKL